MLGISAILLFVVSISAPIIHDIGFLKVKLSNHTTAHHSSVTFGSFGHCVLDVPHIASPSSSSAAVSSATPLQKRKVSRVRNSGEDKCSHRKVGYSPGQIMENITQTHFGKASAKGIKGATHLFVLHPIAFAITLIAFASSCTTGAAGSIAGSLFAFFAWFLTLFLIIVDAIVFAVSFLSFSIIAP